MARHNYVSLLGSVAMNPLVVTENGKYESGIMQVRVLRGPRSVGDHRGPSKTDIPTIISKEPAMIQVMDQVKLHNIVLIKGILSTTRVGKVSYCTHCGASNSIKGLMLYINPIHILPVKACDNPMDALHFLRDNSEISNELHLFGTLIRDPKKVSPKTGLVITQYQIAMNRKYKIRTDDPTKITDYPWVKVYGDNAEEDRVRLHVGSEVYIDGCIQARRINRHAVCPECGEEYDWAENTMEIVPFSTEYIGDFYSDEEIEVREVQRREQQRHDLLLNGKGNPEMTESSLFFDEYTEEEIAAGIDSFEE